MNKKIIIVITIFLLALSALALCMSSLCGNNKPDMRGSSKLQITASFYPLYYFASRIAGAKADVYDITPAGAEPHDYELTPQDIMRIEGSRILILNGGGLEAWGDNIRQNLSQSDVAIINAGDGLTTRDLVEGGKNIVDPHVWLSPVLAQEMADKIEKGLQAADPKNASYYQANAIALKADLQNLDNEYKTGLKECAGHDIITSHAAFGYLAANYNFTQISIAGLSPDAEPSSRQLADITNFAKANGVKYIFFESLTSSKLSQTLADEVGAQILVLNPIEGLTDEEAARGGNYFTQMESNLVNLKIALACK